MVIWLRMESTLCSICGEGAGDWGKPHWQKRMTIAALLRTVEANSNFRRRSALVGLSVLHFLIELLKNEESLLFLPMLGYQPFAVEVILNSRQRAAWAAKVLQNPRRNATQKRNPFQHGNLVLVEILLILLAPAREGSRVFDVSCNGTMLLKRFDIYREAATGPLVKTFT